MLHFRLQLFKPSHDGSQRALMQPGGKLVQLFRRSHRIGFHAAVIQVSHPSCHTDGSRMALNIRAEADPLDPAGNQPAPRQLPLLRLFSQWICSESETLSISAGVDSSAFWTAAHRLWS